ncbi:MAG: DUF1996 domain-containing protein [Pseudomonadota bacterium]
MLNSIIRKPALVLTLPLFALIAASYSAHAEIYKWRDNRGVIQYSDRPPVTNFTKVTRNEMVNALQTKDLCTVGPIVKNRTLKVASNQNVGAFFSKFIRANLTTTTDTTSSTLTSSGSKVTVLGFSKKPVKTSTTTTTTTSTTTTAPTTTTSTTTTPTTSTTTAPTTSTTTPTTTTTDTAPIQVATASPAPTTTTTTSTSANLIQVGLMPAVDISKNIVQEFGYSNLRISATTEQPTISNEGGAFRISCKTSHMSNDDPLVYPNQQGAAHHHTFFGNVSVNYKSDLSNLSAVGNSTCSGGIMNRSAYWVPSMIDTSTHTPVAPSSSIFYYKTTIDSSLLKPPPKGLRMITGNGKAVSSSELQRKNYICYPGPNSKRTTWGWSYGIPKGADCEAGDDLTMQVQFPQCWDGKNLDSPNHKDHMAFPSHRPVAPPNDFYCPDTHPIAIPEISMVLHFTVTKAAQDGQWRLASDNYPTTSEAGYSAHADWVNGWDEPTIAAVVKNCLIPKKDAHAHLLCDGRMFY